MAWLDFDVGPERTMAILGTALATQYVCGRIWGLAAFDPRSALISGLSLCLLCRTNEPLLAVATATAAIASKFALRWRRKHVFNPTNFGLVVMMLVTGQVWVSPGQWGSAATFGFLLASAGGLVVTRARRADVTLVFLGTWAALLFVRSMWLDEPVAIPIHRLESGALILFAFFMISDPKTTPDSRAGRMLFAGIVAAGAYVVQFVLFRTNGFLWSLAVASLLVPVIDWPYPDGAIDGRRQSRQPTRASDRTPTANTLDSPWHRKGVQHEGSVFPGSECAGRARLRAGGARVLRLLRRQGRHQAVQPGVAGCPGAERGQNRAHDGQRLQGRPQGVRPRRAGAHRPRERADPRRRAGGHRTPRRLHGAAAGRVLRRKPVPAARAQPTAGGAGDDGRGQG